MYTPLVGLSTCASNGCVATSTPEDAASLMDEPIGTCLRGKKGREARFVDLCDDVRER